MKNTRSKAIKVKIKNSKPKKMCEACRINMKNASLGKNFRLPPLHPHCNCADNLAQLF